ncbi:M1 family metallopeptidase [Aquimarina macrocephali]|uniref:M1 family metallopeptidase n=1 Tax=Aquimarina macrocephali TaxID=666563 RepID=UPI003F674C5C
MFSKKIVCYSLMLLISSIGISQDYLPVSKNLSEALQKKSRTTKGIPGIKYWQNSASYDITAEIVPKERKLIGTEIISYKNNSPDSLYQLVFHVFQNLYKKGSRRDLPVHPDDVHQGVLIKSLKIDNTSITEYTIADTQLIVQLTKPILTSELITIEIAWSFTIPAKSDIRMGAKDETSFFLGQWYPKIAVYDDISGWDRNIHTGGQEFYYDLGNYKYNIKVPDGYMVWGSGLLQNAKKVLSKNIYDKYMQAQKSDSVIPIVSTDDYTSGKAITQDNTWIFKANNVSDVAFGVSNHFHWDATSIKDITSNTIFIEAVYPAESQDFTEVALLAKKSIHYFSTELPYPFPFPAMTIFNGTNGASGMEYPMIANDPTADNRGRTVDVTAHEIAHNYFPFYVLTNETEYAWMDEAFAAMIPYQYQLNNEPTLNRLTRYAKNMSAYANTERNIASITKSTMLKDRISYFNFYMKPAVGLYVLQDMLGKKLFKECIAAYINTWKGKHPTPQDFFYNVNETSHQNLNWFWKKWFFENGYPDLSIHHVKVKSNMYEITIKKIGDLPIPIDLTVIFKDQTVQNIHRSAAVWQKKDSIIIPIKTTKKIEKISLGNAYIPDTNPKNNITIIE